MRRQTTRLIALAAAAAFVAAVVLTAAPQADPFTGTYTLNVAKSKYNPGPVPKSGSATFSTAGAMVKAVVEGVNGAGEQVRFEYAAAFDGKDHPMKGNPNGDTVSLRRISPTSVETTFKLKGKVTVVNVRSLSADGKTMTVTTKGTNAQGEKVNDVQIMEKK